MSTPSRKPSHSVVPSDDLVPSARERVAPEPELAESANDPSFSPYAPKRARQHAHTQPEHPDKNDASSPALVFDWKRARESTSVASHAIMAAQAETSQHAATTDDVPGTARHDTGLGQQRVLDAVEEAVEAARKAINDSPLRLGETPRSTDAAKDALSTQSGAEHRAKIDDTDLENLEASLRRLQQRHAGAMRLPPAPKLASRSRLTQDEPTLNPFPASLRPLEPTRLMPPPTATRRAPNAMLWVSIGCTVMAGIVYYFLETSPSSTSKTTVQSEVAYVIPRSTSAFQSDERPQAQPLSNAPSENHETLAKAEKSPRPTVTAAATIAAEQETMKTPTIITAAPAPAAGAGSGKPTRRLDPETIALLVREAEKHISTGDVVTARTIFQRAAEAGDATAALELAATYDPTVLARLGVMGMGADVEKARAWYRMAESFGSAEAKQRLRSLDRQ
jgi:hypothetical protein